MGRVPARDAAAQRPWPRGRRNLGVLAHRKLVRDACAARRQLRQDARHAGRGTDPDGVRLAVRRRDRDAAHRIGDDRQPRLGLADRTPLSLPGRGGQLMSEAGLGKSAALLYSVTAVITLFLLVPLLFPIAL